MGQQPHISSPTEHRPRPVPNTAAARRWRPVRPGVITSPNQRPRGPRFGHPGPDAGWAFRILGETNHQELSPEQINVLARLMIARASRFGRAPIPEDMEVAKLIVETRPSDSVQRTSSWEDWVEEAGHEVSPGVTALLGIDPQLLDLSPSELASP